MFITYNIINNPIFNFTVIRYYLNFFFSFFFYIPMIIFSIYTFWIKFKHEIFITFKKKRNFIITNIMKIILSIFWFYIFKLITFNNFIESPNFIFFCTMFHNIMGIKIKICLSSIMFEVVILMLNF